MSRLLACFSLLATVVAAHAADTFDRSVASVALMQNQAVQKELKITAAQRAKMNAAAAKFNAANKAYADEVNKKSNGGKNPVAHDTPREIKMLSELKTSVFAILTDAQIKRLREISLQAVGVAALGDQTVATRVGLSASQLTNVRKTLENGLAEGKKVSDAAMANARKGIKEPDPKKADDVKRAQAQFKKNMDVYGPPAQKKLNQIRQGTIDKVLAILSGGQRTVWNALLGPDFKGG